MTQFIFVVLLSTLSACVPLLVMPPRPPPPPAPYPYPYLSARPAAEPLAPSRGVGEGRAADGTGRP